MTTLNYPIFRVLALLTAVFVFLMPPQMAEAQTTAFRQAVAEGAARDEALADFYRARDFDGIWTGTTGRDRTRRNALLAAFAGAGDHGLPAAQYDPDSLMARLQAANTPAEKGAMEVEMSRLFLSYARSLQTGILTPRNVVAEIRREVPLRSRLGYLQGFEQSNPAAYLSSLAPSSPEYARLLREKLRLERLLAVGGWGPSVSGGGLEPGASGSNVIALRDRLVAMGYMERSATQTYDATVQAAVQRFQTSHGLTADGVAGAGTLREVNVPVANRLQQVIVAMERERWMNRPRGQRHVWVNLTDFTAAIMDNDSVTYQTRSVIGALGSDRESPEFSDVMEYMVINPSWYVPRSIIVNEYLPALQRNRNAVSHIEITDSRGRAINRSSVNFSQFNASTFPYSMRQPPSRGNALGLVKFIFPNQYNIYLHDTPAKSLFSREVRAFSHGCIRLNDPFDFAYALLAAQESDPEGFFQSQLRTGREARVNLDEPVPVHLVYRTAFTHTTGQLNFRRDVYNRDSRIWNALAGEGVAVRSIGG
ncbi:L,D-transpeptidase family protein [Octadecabacter sp. 1_MG-2023]|uniref:L,D-transpeptidase family protein n=1 Tax=unclassified Octadecabacter TaxID=196158 RepID=UPI001C0A33D9|nr:MULTISPECIES: L,D-transpeptidase family protein [unclassified Octadecabacter]MBU2993186.1 L,D-transpeptidase family protein [Octadecabacter sp. B2R22]MDO6733362.1 L,D-transpeptidase family protein [Octadecabacter sp. 1_MG-2023]